MKFQNVYCRKQKHKWVAVCSVLLQYAGGSASVHTNSPELTVRVFTMPKTECTLQSSHVQIAQPSESRQRAKHSGSFCAGTECYIRLSLLISVFYQVHLRDAAEGTESELPQGCFPDGRAWCPHCSVLHLSVATCRNLFAVFTR